MVKPIEIRTYPAVDLIPAVMPPRTLLYNMPPIGLGTALVESMTSFGSRHAHKHYISANSLFLLLVRPHMIQMDANAVRLPTSISDKGWTFNGHHVSSRLMIRVFELMTGRNDLESLSLARWTHVIKMQGLFRQEKAWCPECYRDRRESNEKQYDPLIWALQLITHCLKHGKKLMTRCPNKKCNKTNSVINRMAAIDHCSECNTFLGNPSDEQDQQIPEEIEEQKVILERISELVSAGDDVPSLASPHIVIKNIQRSVNRIFRGNVYNFARDLGVDLSVAFSWYGGLSIPTLPLMLQICKRFNMPLLGLLTDQNTEPKNEAGITVSSKASGEGPSDNDLKEGLLDLLNSANVPAFSLEETADRIGYQVEDIDAFFPELSRKIDIRYQESKQKPESKTMRRRYQLLQETIVMMMKNCILPTPRNLEAVLTRPGLFKKRGISGMWRELIKRFGLDHESLSQNKLDVEREAEISIEYYEHCKEDHNCCDYKVFRGGFKNSG
jgi:hypothetical protein